MSLLILVGLNFRSPILLSPIPTAFSQMLSGYRHKTPDLITSQVTGELTKHKLSYSSININGGDVYTQLNDGTEIVLSGEKDISVQLDSLQYTIAHLTIEGKRIARVDMRFERPVVTFK